ncbi:MAG: hypothetical protein Q9169_007731 [Polycauliona sp. 2 TL-2023]
MSRIRKQLSHEEIWDDSALVDSWELALQEYQLYHSIHARGERVEDVLEEAEDPEELPEHEEGDVGTAAPNNMNGIPQAQKLENEEVEDGEIEDEEVVGIGAKDETVQMKDEKPTGQQHYAPPPSMDASAQRIPEAPAVPAMLMNGGETQCAALSVHEAVLMGAAGHDEGLKNLMMSWYYAGYYTGLYEGRKQPDPAAPQPTGTSQANP